MLAMVHSAQTFSVEKLGPGIGEHHRGMCIGIGTPSVFAPAIGVMFVSAVVQGASAWGDVIGMKLDGRMAMLNDRLGGGNIWSHIGWDADLDLPFLVNYAAAGWATVQPPVCACLNPFRGGGWNNAQAMVPDLTQPKGWRGLGAFGSTTIWIQWGTLDDTLGGLVQSHEYTFPNWYVSGGAQATLLFPAGQIAVPALGRVVRRWWVACRADGQIRLYDSTTKTQVDYPPRFIEPGWLTCTYSRKHDVFVAVYGVPDAPPYTLRVFANEPVAFELTPPVFDRPPTTGRVVKASASVLGEQGEPCPGRIVGFSVSGGTLVDRTAVTDAAGKATVRYQAPLTAQSGLEITATMDE
jgi:hypothetical protein